MGNIWSVTSVLVNNTEAFLHPVSPNSADVWYGSVETAPESVDKRVTDGRAGKFRATAGTATGVTGISVYVSPDPTKAVFLLIMMPYGVAEVNKTKVGFIDVSSIVDAGQVKRLWEDSQFGTSAKYSFAQNGKTVNLYAESKIEQGSRVEATFTLGYI